MTTILYFFMKFLQEKWKIKKSKASMVPIILLLLEGNIDHGEFSGRNKTIFIVYQIALHLFEPITVSMGCMLPLAVKVPERRTSKLNFSFYVHNDKKTD